MEIRKIKTYLSIPLVLTLFSATQVAADTTTGTTTESSATGQSRVTTATSQVSTEATTTTESLTTDTTTEMSEAASSTDESSATTEFPNVTASTTTSQAETNAAGPASSTTQTSASTSTDQATTSDDVVTTVVDKDGIHLKYTPTIAKNEKILFAVWTQANNQDDIVWYESSAAGAAYVEFSKHREYGTYIVHTYANQSGKMVAKDALTLTIAKPEAKATIKRTSETNYQVTVTNVPDTISQVKIPVWTSQNGQDDIKWYDATASGKGTYTLNLSTTSHHAEYGTYNVHVYGYSSVTKGMYGLLATSVDHVDSRTDAVVSITDYAENKTTFTVNVKGSEATKTISSVAIAVWSHENGQDDIKWYQPGITNNQASQTVNIANHANKTGVYAVHVYTNYTDGTRSGTIAGDLKITKAAVKNDVSTNLTKDGIAIKLDSNTVADYTKVRFAVWSDEHGQDDIKWYQADSKGQAVATYENHSGFGKYNVHTYSYETGQPVALSAISFTIAKPSVTSVVTKVSDTEYTVTVSNVPVYVKNVLVPTWSDVKGQDDIIWYSTTQKDSTTYSTTIKLKNHQFATGHYSAHIYGTSRLGNTTVALGDTKGFEVDKPVTTPATIEIQNYNKAAGILTVKVSETAKSKAISSVAVAVWSEEKQANIYWYKDNTVTNGELSVEVSTKNHSYKSGLYNIHVYTTYADGETLGTVLEQKELAAAKVVTSASQGEYAVINKIVYLDAGHGGSDPGATYFGVTEKSLNLSIQNLVKAKLEEQGYQVVLTRSTDTFVGLLERSQAVNASLSDLFISIHFNASGSTATNGIETYYYEYDANYQPAINKTYHNNAERLSRSAYLAQAIQNATVVNTGAANRGVLRNTFAVLRETTAPAILVELGYMSNTEEAKKLPQASYQEKLANGIVSGILNYYAKYN
ncbi:GBS Bsp-like repeat-containing protein [Streptococcus caprae]|uniref:GBS Bsp-like repeat-containing protein n=1 Tax=Streptococcus caprae TaxID=1640501 RepID=A0ABV8CXR9_9STRE